MTTHDDSTAAVADWLENFSAALGRGDVPAAAALFGDEAYWRDLIAFTWNIATIEDRSGIAAMLLHTLARVQPRNWVLDGEASKGQGIAQGVDQAWFSFETSVGRGKGHVRLKDGRCWTLFTTLQELKGFEEKRGETRELGAEHGAIRGRRNWSDARAAEAAELGSQRQP